MRDFKELSFEEQNKINGDFVPLIIWEFAYSAIQVTSTSGACFFACFVGGKAITSSID